VVWEPIKRQLGEGIKLFYMPQTNSQKEIKWQELEL